MKMFSLMALMVPVLASAELALAATAAPTEPTPEAPRPPATAAVAIEVPVGCDLHFRVTPRYDTSPRRLDVTLSFPAEGRTATSLGISRGWAGVNDFGNAISAWSGADGATVQATASPGRVTVHHEAQGRVQIGYQVRTALEDPDDGKPQKPTELYHVQVGKDTFQFFGYGALPSLDDWPDAREGTMCLTLVQPGTAAGPFIGPDLQQLPATGASGLNEALMKEHGSQKLFRHAFFAGGPGWRVTQRALISGGSVTVAFRGKPTTDEAAFADQTAALMQMHRRFWKETVATQQNVVVTPDYTPRNFTGTLVRKTAVVHVPEGFGTQHEVFASLVGHENLHQWLPQRLGRMPGTTSEQSVPHYWLSEGFTDYYTHRLLLASGLWSPQRYADEITRRLQTYWRSPDRNTPAAGIAPRFFSLSDVSRQMYARGEVLAMRWDAELLAAGQPEGLDGLLRGLIRTATDRPDTETAPQRVLTALSAVLGNASPPRDVSDYIDQGRDLPLTPDIAGPCFDLSWIERPRWVPGFDWRTTDNPQHRVAGVIEGGPAWQAGLRDGQPVLLFKLTESDSERDIEMRVQTPDGPLAVRFRPVDGTLDRLPQLTVSPGAASGLQSTEPVARTPEQNACHRWLRALPPA